MIDLAEITGAGGAHLAQEPADSWQMIGDSSRRQSAFSLQIVAEIREYLVLRSDPRRFCRRDHTSVAQLGEEPLQCQPVARVDGPLPGSDTEKPLKRTFIETGQRATAARDPIQEIADQAEASPNASASEANFSETRRVPFDELSVGSVLE